MKYKFTVTLDIKDEPLPTAKALKTISEDIRATLEEINDVQGIGYDAEHGESWCASSIKVESCHTNKVK